MILEHKEEGECGVGLIGKRRRMAVHPLRAMAIGATIALAVVVAFPTAAPAYVEGEYLNKFNEEQNRQSVEREKEREAEAAANLQRKQEEEHAPAARERSAREEREVREQEERSEREAAEQRVAAREARAGECVVPVVIGDSLPVAGKVLRHAHCTLGKVSRSRVYRGRLVVTGESRLVGTRLPRGTTVAVKLGRPKQTSHKSRHA